jgi:hypothetical protein
MGGNPLHPKVMVNARTIIQCRVKSIPKFGWRKVRAVLKKLDI